MRQINPLSTVTTMCQSYEYCREVKQPKLSTDRSVTLLCARSLWLVKMHEVAMLRCQRKRTGVTNKTHELGNIPDWVVVTLRGVAMSSRYNHRRRRTCVDLVQPE